MQINERCTIPQIKALLKEYKSLANKDAAKDLLYSGNKPELIANLKRGVEKKLIPLHAVLELLRISEENGHQHIFYYKPTGAVRDKLRDFDAVMASLFGDEWDDKFPIFEYPKKGCSWVDARKGIKGKPRDWVLKTYGTDSGYKKVREETSRGGKSKTLYFDLETYKIVCLVRWNDPDLLEVRIDTEGLGSVKKRVERLANMWKMLTPLVTEASVPKWSLERSLTSLVRDRKSEGVDYVIGDVTIKDSGRGTHRVQCPTIEESLDDVQSRGDAINILLADSGKGQSTIVHWKLPPQLFNRETVEDDDDESASANGSSDQKRNKKVDLELLTACGGRFQNEVAISARVSPEIVDHVTNRLRQSN